MELQLKGWPALIVVVLALGVVVGYRVHLHSNPEISAELEEKLEFDLMGELAGEYSADAKAMDAAIQRGDTRRAERIGQNMLKRRVAIDDFDMRGGGDDIIVRAEYTLYGPDGPRQRVGYYRYSYSSLTGWLYQYETSVWSWRFKLF